MDDMPTLNLYVRKRLEKGLWLVGVSGGGDSVAMLRQLVEEGCGEHIIVGNFDHGWGEFGRASQLFVKELCATLKVPFVSGKGNGRAATNTEAVARNERYAWMKAVCEAQGLEGVLVAHTLEDRVETFLMRAGKGSGLQGLAGMKASSAWQGMTVFRPLLHWQREALRDYLRALGQDWLEDPDNEAGGSQRARLRKLLPELEAAGVKIASVAASLNALSAADAVVEEVVDDIGITWLAEREAALELNALRGVLPEVGSRVLGRLMQAMVPEAGVVRRGKRVALLARLRDEEQGHATLGGLKFEWNAGALKARPE